MEVHGEELFEDFFVRQVLWPAVGGEDGSVEGLVGELEPGGTLVVEIGERAAGQLARGLVRVRNQTTVADRADAARVGVVYVAGPQTVHRAGKFQHLLARPLRRIEPVIPQPIQLPRRLRDSPLLLRRRAAIVVGNRLVCSQDLFGKFLFMLKGICIFEA